MGLEGVRGEEREMQVAAPPGYCPNCQQYHQPTQMCPVSEVDG